MADAEAGPSSGAKRRRGPPQRPRGVVDPAAPRPPRLVRRRIQYRAAEVRPQPGDVPVPLDARRLRDHTLLQFERLTQEYHDCQRFVAMGMLVHRRIDWDLVGQLGQRERIEQMLGHRWRSVLECEWAPYDELTVEFHSTWRYTAPRFDHPESLSFSLGRQVFEMTVPQFAVALGFYTEEEVRLPAFEQSLRGVTSRRDVPGISEGRLAEFWETIGDTAFNTSVLESSIRDPVIRYIHRILACTLIGRRSGTDKCSQLDLFCLYCIVGGHEANLASIFISSMARPRRGGREARLDLGPYIGRLAERLGVFDRYPQEFLTPGPGTITYDLEDLRKAGICPWDPPPRWAPVSEAREVPVGVMQRGVPPLAQRAAARLERAQRRPPREYPPAPFTLEDLRDQIFERIDGVERRFDERMDRTDAAIRYLMTEQEIEIPDFFRDPEEDANDDDAGDEAGPSGTAQDED